MRFSRAFVTIAVLLAGLSAADAREEHGASIATDSIDANETPQAEKPVSWTAPEALQIGILKDITSRKSRARDEKLSASLDELGTLYAAEFREPLWIDSDGLTQRARKALKELRRADEWGLVPADYDIRIPADFTDDAGRARFEIDFTFNLLKYVDHARGGRFSPTEMSLWFEGSSGKGNHMEVLRQLAETNAPRPLLAAQHPQHEGFKRLREVYLHRKFPERFSAAAETETKPRPIILDYGRSVRRGQRHPQIALLRRRLKVPAASAEDADLYDRELMNAVNDFMRTQGWRRKHVYDNKVRSALNEANGVSPKKKSSMSLQDIVANMEKWRWLPRELGDMYVWNNLPSFTTKVVKNGTVIHEERIIIGKPNTQTPVFSDTMTHVIFKPQWGSRARSRSRACCHAWPLATMTFSAAAVCASSSPTRW